MWSERGNKSLKNILRLIFSKGFQTLIFCGCQDQDFGQLDKVSSFVDESTALSCALDVTKEVRLSYHTAITAITPCQDFSDISAQPSGRS